MVPMDIELRVKQNLSKRLGIAPDRVALDASLVDDLGIDSIDIVELTIATEQEFQITLGDDALREVRTVQDLVDIIERLVTSGLVTAPPATNRVPAR